MQIFVNLFFQNANIILYTVLLMDLKF